MRIQAWDVSPEHAAVVEVDAKSGELLWHCFTTTGPRAHAKKPDSVLLPEYEKVAKSQKSCSRIVQLAPVFLAWASRNDVLLIAIEDYAMGASQGSHFIGEVGGVARLAVLQARRQLRLWGLKSIKKFFTGSGAATKDDMKAEAERRGIRFAYSAKADEDLFDAYALSRLVLAEMALRSGADPMKLQKHEREVLCRKLDKDDPMLAWQRPLITV